MPVSKTDQVSSKICKYCDESAHCRIWNIRFDQDILNTIKRKFPNWFLPLKNKHKSFTPLKTRTDIMSEAPSTSSLSIAMDSTQARVSPPKVIVDSSSLQTAIDKNRESLKVKLLVRRSANQLAEQNILPPLKTSPAIYEQSKSLERAKTGDFLKAKMQQRPNRQELERRHILDSHEAHIDPSLADRKRQLEKAILHDQMNRKIQNRPGPFELIEKNILHTDEPIERIVKEGLVPFKISTDNLAETNFLSFEDDSQSSEGDLYSQSSQIQTDILKEANAGLDAKSMEVSMNTHNKNIFEALPTSGIINISLVPTNNIITSSPSAPISVATFKIHNPHVETINIPTPPPPPKLELITYHVKPMVQTQVKGLLNTQNFLPIQITETPMNGVNTIRTPSLVPTQTQNAVNQHVSSFIQNNQKFSAPGKEKNRKKCKNKAASKARAIKFHEYKGPPSKGSSSSSSTSFGACKKVAETNYELMMQQKSLLDYLEEIYKNPSEVAAQPESDTQKYSVKAIKSEKTETASEEREKSTGPPEKPKTFNKPHVTIFPSKPSIQTSTVTLQETPKDMTITDVSKLSKMKVSELKAYLKRVNLPVSGSKPLLIERLKPYLPLKPLEDNNKDETSSMVSESNDYYNASLHSVSSAESDMDNMDAQQSLSTGSSSQSTTKEEDIVAEQQRKIEELQRKLQQSQHELEQMKQTKQETSQPMDTQKIVFDPQYQIHSPISTVFVVDVAQPSPVSVEDHNSVASPIKVPTPVDTSLLLDIHDMTLKAPVLDKLLHEENDPTLSLSEQIDKEVNASTSNVIPMSQDITDVLEILLKNGEWPDLEDDGKGGFIQSTCNHSPISSANLLSAKHFIDDVLSSHHPYDAISPMNEDPILHVDESIEKILDTVTPSNVSFTNGFHNHDNIEFPMDIEEDSSMPDFNRNLFQNSADFHEKPRQTNLQSYEQNHFNQNCDNQFHKSVKNNSQDAECPSVKSNFPETSVKPQSNCTKNGLIGNFDHNLFDTLRINNINNNNNHNSNDMFLIPDEVKFAKDENKSLINNLHLTNNYDLFTTGLDNTAMDFESIIPYNDLQSHDSLFQISGFDNTLSRSGNFGGFSDHNNSLLFNDDTRMSNGEMTCEVDNLLCNL